MNPPPPGRPSVHLTVIFNVFVLMQLFNEINCRKIFGERNVFAGVTANPWFLSIMATTFALQVVMTQWGGLGLGCVAGGLTLDQVRVVSTRTI